MQFTLVLAEHRILGFVFSAYLLKRERGKEYFTTYDKLTLQKLPSYNDILTPEQVQIVKNIENYNDQNLFKLFCKKKVTSFKFINSLDSEILEKHIRPYIERQIIKCIDILHYNPEPIYHKVMQNKIYDSDRLHLVDHECNTVFNFEHSQEGIKYKLTIEYSGQELVLNGKSGIVLVNDPCCLAIEDKLFVFRDIDGKKLTPFFEKEHISIPKQSEQKYFESFVKKALAKYKVKAVGFLVEDIEGLPRAVVSLENDLAGHLSLVLKFIYNDKSIVYANRASGVRVVCSYNDTPVRFTRTARNNEYENSCITKLLSMGLVNKDGPYFLPIKQKKVEDKIYGPITWLNRNKKILHNNGFEISQKNLDKEYYLDEYELKFEVSEKTNDWFDLLATVEFDGFKIPFIEFREYIINEIREYKLPNDKVLILPEDWFESYSDLINFSKEDGEYLKLKRQHFSILNNKIGKLSDSFRDNLKSLLQTEEEPPEEIPNGVKAELRNYQQIGYTWMYRLYQNGFGGCLADDMGLGKTLQTLTLLKRINGEVPKDKITENSKVDVQLDLFGDTQLPSNVKASLIVVPTSLIHNWQHEINRFVPSLKVKAYIGSTRGKLEDSTTNADIIVTSYGILRNDLEQFTREHFLYIILDESQTIKNPGSKTYASVIQLKADYRLVLSGTPIENSLTDLWAQFNFINPGLLGNLNFFQTEFQFPVEKHGDENKKERLKQLIAPFIMRRSKAKVAKELPELSEQLIQCDMNEVQEVFYDKEKSKARNLILENINKYGLQKATFQILQSLMRLRQMANHPYLVDKDYIGGSGKFDEVKRHLSNLNSEGHKALVFSSFVGHLNLVSEWLDEQGIGYTVLTGETRKRQEVVREFQEEEDCRFFLISLKAGGVGLNLTAASYVLMLDPWWNPAAEKQAINRAHRIGQDKHVMVYRFITQNTLEEKILKLQEQKTELADIFISENSLKNISQDEIMDLFE